MRSLFDARARDGVAHGASATTPSVAQALDARAVASIAGSGCARTVGWTATLDASPHRGVAPRFARVATALAVTTTLHAHSVLVVANLPGDRTDVFVVLAPVDTSVRARFTGAVRPAMGRFETFDTQVRGRFALRAGAGTVVVGRA